MQVKCEVKKFLTSKLHGWSGCATKLITTLDDWKPNNHSLELEVEITNVINLLFDSIKFLYLPVFQTRCLASLLEHKTKDIDNKTEVVLAQMKVVVLFQVQFQSLPVTWILLTYNGSLGSVRRGYAAENFQINP